MKKKTFEHYISPVSWGGPAWPTFKNFGVLDHNVDVIVSLKFQIDWLMGLRGTCAQTMVFPIDFHRRPYYRATL